MTATRLNLTFKPEIKKRLERLAADRFMTISGVITQLVLEAHPADPVAPAPTKKVGRPSKPKPDPDAPKPGEHVLDWRDRVGDEIADAFIAKHGR